LPAESVVSVPSRPKREERGGSLELNSLEKRSARQAKKGRAKAEKGDKKIGHKKDRLELQRRKESLLRRLARDTWEAQEGCFSGSGKRPDPARRREEGGLVLGKGALSAARGERRRTVLKSARKGGGERSTGGRRVAELERGPNLSQGTLLTRPYSEQVRGR